MKVILALSLAALALAVPVAEEPMKVKLGNTVIEGTSGKVEVCGKTAHSLDVS